MANFVTRYRYKSDDYAAESISDETCVDDDEYVSNSTMMKRFFSGGDNPPPVNDVAYDLVQEDDKPIDEDSGDYEERLYDDVTDFELRAEELREEREAAEAAATADAKAKLSTVSTVGEPNKKGSRGGGNGASGSQSQDAGAADSAAEEDAQISSESAKITRGH